MEKLKKKIEVCVFLLFLQFGWGFNVLAADQITESKITDPIASCMVNQPIETYPDGAIKQCSLATEKTVADSPQGAFSVSEFTCAKGSSIGFFPDGKVASCTPVDYVYMRGKGTCLPGQPLSLQPDGKVQECVYTYPLYQNTSCKAGEKASFHANGSFRDCILPTEQVLDKAICKADAPVSYNPDGSIASCTLSQSVFVSPEITLPADSVVSFDETRKIFVIAKKPTV